MNAEPDADRAPDPTAAEKRRIRAAVREARRSMTSAAREAAASRLTTNLSRLVRDRGARTVSCYLPLPDEPDTSGFVSLARATGIDVLLPISRADGTLAWALADETPPTPGRHGIDEPAGPLLPADALATVDLLLIPACAVDRSGTRLGWGRGYFDRALSDLSDVSSRPPVYAVVFEDDVFSDLPREPHDVPVSGAVTDRGVHLFASE